MTLGRGRYDTPFLHANVSYTRPLLATSDSLYGVHTSPRFLHMMCNPVRRKCHQRSACVQSYPQEVVFLWITLRFLGKVIHKAVDNSRSAPRVIHNHLTFCG